MDDALATWRAKLEFLQKEEALAVSPDAKFTLVQQIKEARAKIAELEADHPDDANENSRPSFDISRIIKYAPAELIGRAAETKLLADAWDKAVREENNRPHVFTFVALGGEGKTSVVAKWAAELAFQNWPGCDAAFAWSFYSQGSSEQMAASSDLFLREALTVFGDPTLAGSAQSAFDKGRRLAQLVGERRALLILDGLEPLQYAPTSPTAGELKDQGLSALLKGLAANNRGLCVITTRYSIPDLKAFWQTTAPETKLTRLSQEAGVVLLKWLGVKGTPQEFEKLVEDVQGHALTLNLLGAWLRDAHAGDIRKRDLVKLAEADAEEQGGHAFRVMDAYATSLESEGEKGKRALALLQLLGLFDRPATADCLGALQHAPAIAGLTEALVEMSEAQRNVAFARLTAARLLTVNRDAAGTLLSLDAHPLLREYFARQLREQQPDAWRSAHRRLYEHLVETTHEGDEPTLEDLQPLYQAIAHGCQAGLQQEVAERVLYSRVRRGKEAYTMKRLGVFGSDLSALACFFEQPWTRISPTLTEIWQSWLPNEAAFSLRALGRLAEALEPMRASGEMNVKVKEWEGASRSYSNLSELELTLGDVVGAGADAEQSVIYADRSGDAFMRMVARAKAAVILHQAGRRTEAQRCFGEAEQMQAERQPDYPLLYSLQGFNYGDLLLAAPERSAWQLTLRTAALLAVATSPDPRAADSLGALFRAEDATGHKAALQSCYAVSQRAAKMFEWRVPSDSLLDVALDHLTLGRAALYEGILRHSDSRLLTSDHLDAAVTGLRRAGTTHWIPAGLLTRAWLRFLTGTHIGLESAQEDLDEAWEIAERGPMRLFMADIHLYRARLFGGMKDEGGRIKYPWDKHPDGTPRWPKDDLAAARKLIEQCGYWRRKEELEDAEAAAENW